VRIECCRVPVGGGQLLGRKWPTFVVDRTRWESPTLAGSVYFVTQNLCTHLFGHMKTLLLWRRVKNAQSHSRHLPLGRSRKGPKSVDLINGSAPEKKSSAGYSAEYSDHSADLRGSGVHLTSIQTEIHSFRNCFHNNYSKCSRINS
jgi:hypothetical protein